MAGERTICADGGGCADKASPLPPFAGCSEVTKGKDIFLSVPFCLSSPSPCLAYWFLFTFLSYQANEKNTFPGFPYWCGFLVLVSILFLSDKHIVKSQFFLFN